MLIFVKYVRSNKTFTFFELHENNTLRFSTWNIRIKTVRAFVTGTFTVELSTREA